MADAGTSVDHYFQPPPFACLPLSPQIKDRSFNALAKLAKKGLMYDIVYIDGAHDTLNVLSDALLGWGLLREGGLMIFDDYDWKDDKGVSAVKVGLDHFMAGVEREVGYSEILGAHTLVLKKGLS